MNSWNRRICRAGLVCALLLTTLFPAPGKPVPKVDVNAHREAQAEILREIKRFPPARKADVDGLAAFNVAQLPDSAVDFNTYRHAGFDPFSARGDALREMSKKFPLRMKVFEISTKLNEVIPLRMDETLEVGNGPFDAKAKKRFLDEQKDPALVLLELEELLEDVKKVLEDRDAEKSKRWQAHFDLARARLLSRIVYIYEHNSLLAALRRDTLPEFDPAKHVGWRIEPSATTQIREATVRLLARDAVKTWDHILVTYPGTPWAALAERERDRPAGLRWTHILRSTIEDR